MAVKLIALDLDGTLLDNQKKLSERNRQALQKAHEAGAVIVPATGRFFRAMPETIRCLPFVRYAITINGAAVFDAQTQDTIYRAEISLPDAEKLFDYMDQLPVVYDCYQDNWGWMDQRGHARLAEFVSNEAELTLIRDCRTPLEDFRKTIRERGRAIQKTQMLFRDLECRRSVLEEMPKHFPEMAISSAFSYNVEINSAEANKGAALRALCRHLGIEDMQQVMAFGDGLNDLAMLRAAGIGVAMGNASDAVKAEADMVTESNVCDGVAVALERCGVI